MNLTMLSAVFRAAQHCLLFGTSMLVPACRRTEWRREWLAELWHVRHATTDDLFSWQGERTVCSFCCGSLQDAWCLRRQPGVSHVPFHSSALRSVVLLAALLALCMVIAYRLPGVRAEEDAGRYHLRPGLMLIQNEDGLRPSTPSVSAAQFRDWQSTDQRYFHGLAFYSSTKESVAVESEGTYFWQVAHASSNLFTLLGIPVQMSDADGSYIDGLPAAVVSYDAWVRNFGADPHVTGRIVHLGTGTARIVGVAPCSSVQLPTNPDIWLLDSADSVSAHSEGFVIALLSPLGKFVASSFMGRTPIGLNDSREGAQELSGISLSDQSQGMASIGVFAFFLALLALPAVTSVSMSESTFSSHRPSWKRSLNRWLFLSTKFALIIAIAYFASLVAAYSWTETYSSAAELVQFSAGFVMSLFGLRWALLDQRHRCPVCLRLVTHPASVGHPSQTFLGWNGTEMMCVGGHTLLHVPSLPTSWFGAQRWLYLDTSWEFLFADS
jgi:hypothetical protein